MRSVEMRFCLPLSSHPEWTQQCLCLSALS